MVKHSRRNNKQKKNSSRRNLKLKNPKPHKKRATTFRKKPFNLRRSTLKKRQHGGATQQDLNTLYALLPADDSNPTNWDAQNNPFNNMTLDNFQRFRAEVQRIINEQGAQGFDQIPNFQGQKRRKLRNIQQFITANAQAITNNIAQQAPAPVPVPPANQGQVGVDNALAANQRQVVQVPPANQGQVPPLQPGVAPVPPANQGQVPPLQPGVAPVPLANQGQVGVDNALAANQRQVVQAPPLQPGMVPPANQGQGAPVPPQQLAAARGPNEQVITINITAPPGTIANLGGDARLDQNNLAQVDVALADLVQNFAL